MKLALKACLAIALFAAPASALLPSIPNVPVNLSPGVRLPLIEKQLVLERRKSALRDEATDINRACSKVVKGSADHTRCLIRQDSFDAGVSALDNDVREFTTEIDLAVHGELARVTALERTLTAAIDRDLTAIRRLGFDSRAEDFEAWNNLAASEREKFEDSMCAVTWQNDNDEKECMLHKVSLASVAYSVNSSATQLVAVREVKRLTTMTETQLIALRKINALLVKHVRERSEAKRVRESIEAELPGQ